MTGRTNASAGSGYSLNTAPSQTVNFTAPNGASDYYGSFSRNVQKDKLYSISSAFFASEVRDFVVTNVTNATILKSTTGGATILTNNTSITIYYKVHNYANSSRNGSILYW